MRYLQKHEKEAIDEKSLTALRDDYSVLKISEDDLDWNKKHLDRWLVFHFQYRHIDQETFNKIDSLMRVSTPPANVTYKRSIFNAIKILYCGIHNKMVNPQMRRNSIACRTPISTPTISPETSPEITPRGLNHCSLRTDITPSKECKSSPANTKARLN